ncbi:hypothetical protein ACFYT5_38770 [Streptomyces anulatus]|uniref:hypothetical protein n=1 Tax=Streptomyces anulatus TaxID=1892 RepID=UPI0036C06B07
MRFEGLTEADGLHVKQDFSDGLLLVLHREELPDKGDDRAGGALHGIWSGLRRVNEDPPEGLQGEGAVVRFRVGAAQSGDWDDDSLRDGHDQRGQPRIGLGESGGRFGAAGLYGPEIAEGAE